MRGYVLSFNWRELARERSFVHEPAHRIVEQDPGPIVLLPASKIPSAMPPVFYSNEGHDPSQTLQYRGCTKLSDENWW